MKEILDIRLNLEIGVVERACEIAPPALLPSRERSLRELEASTGSPCRYLIKNSEFHFTIYTAADMPIHSFA